MTILHGNHVNVGTKSMTTLKVCHLTSAWFMKCQFEESMIPSFFVYRISLQEWLNMRRFWSVTRKMKNVMDIIQSVQSQVGQGFEQPGLLKDVHTHGGGDWTR